MTKVFATSRCFLLVGLVIFLWTAWAEGKSKRGARKGKASEYIGTQRFRPKSLDRLALSVDGKVLVSAGSTEIAVWDPKSGRKIKTMNTWSGRMGLSADGRRVAGLDFSFLGLKLVVYSTRTGRAVRSWACKDSNAVDHLALNRDGTLLVVGLESGKLELRSLAKGGQLKILQGHEGGVEAMAISPADDNILASGGKDGQLKIWDLKNAQSRILPAGKKTIMDLDFTPDGQTLVAADSAGFVYIYDVLAGSLKQKFLARIPGEPSEIRGVAVARGGRSLLTGTWSGVIGLWTLDASGPQLVSVLAEGGLVAAAVAFSPDGQTAYGGVDWGALRRFNAATGVELSSPEQGNLFAPDSMVWTAGGQRAVVAAGGKDPLVWNIARRKVVARLSGHTRRVEQVAATLNGKLIASGGNDGWVRLWDGQTLKQLHAGRDQAGEVSALALSADGSLLVSGGAHGSLVVRHTRTFEKVFQRAENDYSERVFSVALSPDNALLLNGDTMGRVEWLDLATGAPLAIRADDYPSNMRSIVFSPDGKLVATSASDKVRVFQVATAQPVVSFGVPGWTITNPVWLPDARRLAFADSDGHLWLADALKGQVLRKAHVEKRNLRSLAVHPNGKQILSGQRDTSMRLWRVSAMPRHKPGGELDLKVERTPPQKLKQAHQLPRSAREQCGSAGGAGGDTRSLPACALERMGPAGMRLENSLEDDAGVLRFSRDGKLLAAGCSERLSVFEVPSGKVLHKLPCCMAASMAAEFSPDGRWLAVTPYMGLTQMWNLATGLREAQWPFSARVMAVSPDGQRWAGATRKGYLKITGPKTRWSKATSLPLEDLLPVNNLSFSPDGNRLLALRASRLVHVWELKNGKVSWTLGLDSEEIPEEMSLLLEESLLLWAGFDPQGRIVLNTPSHQFVRHSDGKWRHKNRQLVVREDMIDMDDRQSVPCSNDGRVCALRHEQTIIIGQPDKKTSQLKVGDGERFALDRSGKLLALAQDEDVVLWDLNRGRRIGLAPQPHVVPPLSLSSSGALLTPHEKGLSLWSRPAHKLQQRLSFSTNQALLTRDGKYIMALEEKALVRIVVSSGKRRVLLEGRFSSNLAMTQDGQRLAFVLDTEVQDQEEIQRQLVVCDGSTGKILFRKPVPSEDYKSGTALSRDGRLVARTAGNKVAIWSVGRVKPVLSIDVEHEVDCMVFGPDGRWLVTGGDSHMDIYSAKDGRYLGHMGDHANIQSLAMSQDGSILVSAGLDHLVRVFHVKERRLLAVLAGHDRWVYSVSLSEKPPRAVSLDAGGTILMWDLGPWLK